MNGERGAEAVFFSRYPLDANDTHGGIHRSQQVAEALAATGVHLAPPSASTMRHVVAAMLHHPRAWMRATRLVPRILTHGVNAAGLLAALTATANVYAHLARRTMSLAYLDVGEDRSQFAAIALHAERIPYTTIPHNVECVVPGQSQRRWFRQAAHQERFEAWLHRNAIHVWAISEHDAIHIRAWTAAPVDVFPYHPPQHLAARLAAIRQARAHTEKEGILILGSADNPPTRAGLERLFRALGTLPCSTTFLLAGRGSERLTSGAPPGIRVLGTIDDATLDALLERVTLTLVSHVATSGFMTRLVDVNHAGVPTLLIGDYVQARGLEAYGIRVLDDLENLTCNDLERAWPTILATFPQPRLQPQGDDGPTVPTILSNGWGEA